MDDYISIKEASRRSAMSERILRNHLDEIPHYRMAARGKIRVRWSDVAAWIERHRVECRQDEDVRAILSDLLGAA